MDIKMDIYTNTTHPTQNTSTSTEHTLTHTTVSSTPHNTTHMDNTTNTLAH
eukprot:m.145086 g.145086  ORF g.145086 m.145086 type:complete len:51 (-) comp92077_c0_seq1:32-184(-)